MEKIPFWKCPGEWLLKNTEQNTWKKLVITLICGLRLKALVICTKIDWPCGEWVDLKISCGCISGYQARKGLHIETVKFDLHKFCHLKKLCKSYIFKIYQRHLFLGGNSCIDFFLTRKLTIKWRLSKIRTHSKISWKIEHHQYYLLKSFEILYWHTVLLKIISDFI